MNLFNLYCFVKVESQPEKLCQFLYLQIDDCFLNVTDSAELLEEEWRLEEVEISGL
jgi:hypothetical protein